jgi:hypothetical protein
MSALGQKRTLKANIPKTTAERSEVFSSRLFYLQLRCVLGGDVGTDEGQ